MQSYDLTVDKFLDHAAKWWANREIVTAGSGRIGYAGLRERANCLSGALRALGLGFGNAVATLAWNTQEHLEVYYGVMGAGMVCHTLNPRLTVAHLAAMVDEAQDRVLAVSADLADLARQLVACCPSIEIVVLLGDDQAAPAMGCSRSFAYEANPRGTMLHIGNDRRAQRRSLHASVQLSAHIACAAG
jgi:fatty-acyl-CoA synthase